MPQQQSAALHRGSVHFDVTPESAMGSIYDDRCAVDESPSSVIGTQLLCQDVISQLTEEMKALLQSCKQNLQPLRW